MFCVGCSSRPACLLVLLLVMTLILSSSSMPRSSLRRTLLTYWHAISGTDGRRVPSVHSLVMSTSYSALSSLAAVGRALDRTPTRLIVSVVLYNDAEL